MSDSGDPKQDRQREQEAEREFYGTTDGTNTTPKSELVQTPSNNIEAEIKEKLAAIEHERWSDWQKWCHQVLRQELPVEVIPFLNDMVLARWERQIDTPYEALSDKEKASDMEQVDRYWPLIQEYVSQVTVQARIDELESHSNQWRVWQDDTTNVKLDDVIAWYDTRLAALQSQSKAEEKE